MDLKRYLIFHDWLRKCEADCHLYEKTIRHLSTHSWEDMNQYAEAKSEVVAQIIATARKAAATASHPFQVVFCSPNLRRGTAAQVTLKSKKWRS